MNSQVLAFERFLFSFFKFSFFFLQWQPKVIFFSFQKALCSAKQLPLTKFTSGFLRMETMNHALKCGGCLVKQPRHILQLRLFSREDYFRVFISLSCLPMSSLFSILLCLHCHLEWKCFSNFMHIFHGIRLVAQWGAKPKKPKRDSTMTDPSCVSRLERLDSANLRPGEIGEMWVCFRSRGFRINYDLTVDLWWVYSQEVSYSRCITGKAWADVTWGCSLRRMAVSGVKFYASF